MSWLAGLRMPGKSFTGELPPLTPRERVLEGDLRRDLVRLSVEIGERHLGKPERLAQAADFIEASFSACGLEVRRQTYTVAGQECSNLEAEVAGTDPGVVLVGAHYDTIPGCPGANDNGSGLVGTLALARAFAGRRPSKTLRFVAWVNEEPPHFQSSTMGSLVYAQACARRSDPLEAVLCLETIGCYLDEKGSQSYPFPLNLMYPDRGNFLAFVSDPPSTPLLRRLVESFRRLVKFPSQGVALPPEVPGVSWSDQWSFWEQGYQAVMITDTAPFRYKQYHTPQDTVERIRFSHLARVIAGIEDVVAEWTGTSSDERGPNAPDDAR